MYCVTMAMIMYSCNHATYMLIDYHDDNDLFYDNDYDNHEDNSADDNIDKFIHTHT